MIKWQVLLKGESWDLEDLYKNQQSHSWKIIKDDKKYFLESTKFQESDDADEIRNKSRDLLELINGSAKLRISGFRPVNIDGNQFAKIDENGKRNPIVDIEAEIKTREKNEILEFGTNQIGATKKDENDLIEQTFNLAGKNKNVEEALRFFSSKNTSWVELYKIHEIIEADPVGRIILKNYKKDSKRFTGTAQYSELIGREARHARRPSDPPKNSMTKNEADSFISILLIKWIDSIIAEGN
jgi:hypothetical protein